MDVPQTDCWCGHETAAGRGWEGPPSSLGALGGDLGGSGWGGGEGEQGLPQCPRWADRVPAPYSTKLTLCLRILCLKPDQQEGDSPRSCVQCPQHARLILPADLALGCLPPRVPLPDLSGGACPPLGDVLGTSGSERRAKLDFSRKQSAARRRDARGRVPAARAFSFQGSQQLTGCPGVSVGVGQARLQSRLGRPSVGTLGQGA